MDGKSRIIIDNLHLTRALYLIYDSQNGNSSMIFGLILKYL